MILILDRYKNIMPYKNAFIVGCKWYLCYIYNIPTTSPESSYGLCLDSTRGLSNLQSNLCNLNQTLFPSLQAPQTLQMQHWNDLKGINISSRSHKSVGFYFEFSHSRPGHGFWPRQAGNHSWCDIFSPRCSHLWRILWTGTEPQPKGSKRSIFP